jgi:hypothetical protein
MGLVVGYDKPLDQVAGSARTTMGRLSWDGTYPTNGEPFTARQFGLTRLFQLHVFPSAGYIFEPDHAALKLKAYYADYDALTDSPLIEVANNVSLAALTAVQWKAGLVAVGMGRGLPPRQGFLGHHRTLLPQLLGSLMVDVGPELAEHDPGEFPRMKPCIERFELIDLLAHSLGHPGRPALPRSRDVVGEQPEHALLLETADQPPHGIGMCVRVLCPLRGCSTCQEDQGADELVPPLDLIHEVQLKLGKLGRRVHGTPSLCALAGGRGFMYHTRGRLSLRNERRAIAQGMVRGQDPLNSPYMSRKSWRGLHLLHPTAALTAAGCLFRRRRGHRRMCLAIAHSLVFSGEAPSLSRWA